MNWQDYISILAAPLAVGLLIVITHVSFGREVLRRGIIFIDLTIAQVAAGGVVLAELLFHEPSIWVVQLAAVLAALSVSSLLAFSEKRWPESQEALIGAAYVLAASFVVLLLAGNPHGGQRLNELLSGQILWVTWDQLLPLFLLYGAVLLVWYQLRQYGRLWFYLLFALVVTSSVQLVGLYLVFATLVIPGLLQKLSGASNLVTYGLALVAYFAGLTASFLMDWPSGPLVVLMLALIGTLSFLFTSASKRKISE